MDDDRQIRDSRGGSSDDRSVETTVNCAEPPDARFDIEPSPIGSTIGRYIVLDEVAEGGMGRVLRAYDPRLQREVALKRVRHDNLDETTAARLIVEARAMAKLSHPNVVPIYDVEEIGPGDVIIAMEFVAGQTLRHWLREGERDRDAILGAFAQAGRGLVAAHEVGLLHRDFKPANVLCSDRGAVKVTDFGLAKVATDSSSNPSGGTSSGSVQALSVTLTGAGSVMGTPRYMAPEQHAGDALTPAADQYAFCVALWEALCGAPPFTDKQIPWGKTNGPPAWPEPAVPTPIVQAIRRGLSPHPDDRWPSMADLLEAITHEPPRLGRRWVVGAVGVSAVLSLLWASQQSSDPAPCTGAAAQLIGIWDGARQDEVRAAFEAIDRPYATRVAERITEALDEYAAAWMSMHTDTCRATTVRGEQSSEVMDLRMGCLHRAAVVLRATTEQLAHADADTVTNAHALIANLRPLARCEDVDALKESTAPGLPEQAEAVDGVRVLVAEAQAALAAGHYGRAQNAIDAAVTAGANVDYGPMHTEVALVRGEVLDALGDYAAAETSLQHAMELASKWRLWEEQADAAIRLMDVVGSRQQRMAEALLLAPLTRGLAVADPRTEAAAASVIASVLRAQGKFAQAEAEERRALAVRLEAHASHAEIAKSRNSLGLVLRDQGRVDEAEAEHRQALALLEELLGAEHPSVATSRNNLANTLASQGKFTEAEAEHRRALAVRESSLSPSHPYVGSTLNNLGNVLEAQGRLEEAEATHRRALAVRIEALGPEHPDVADSRNNLASVLQGLGRLSESETEYRSALTSRESVLGPKHPDVALSHYNLALLLQAQGEHEAAQTENRLALAQFEEALGPEHPFTATARHSLAEILLAAGRAAEALPLAERAWQSTDERTAPDTRGARAFVLAEALWEGGEIEDRPRSRKLAEDARKAFREAATTGTPTDDAVDDVSRWLETHRVQRGRGPG